LRVYGSNTSINPLISGVFTTLKSSVVFRCHTV